MGKLNPHSHKRLDTRQRIIVGITFFSMFFGAGNLIFPPYLGALAGNRTLVGMVGFVVSAVGLPILGVIVVAQAGGFGNLSARVSKRFALVLGVAIMLTIGPLFAIPRTASTSFEMAVVPFAGQQNLWLVRLLYSLVFFGLAFLVAQHPDKLSQVLGQGDGPTAARHDRRAVRRLPVRQTSRIRESAGLLCAPSADAGLHRRLPDDGPGLGRPLFRHCHLREHLLDGRRRRA